jgi:hypothetical protein
MSSEKSIREYSPMVKDTLVTSTINRQLYGMVIGNLPVEDYEEEVFYEVAWKRPSKQSFMQDSYFISLESEFDLIGFIK